MKTNQQKRKEILESLKLTQDIENSLKTLFYRRRQEQSRENNHKTGTFQHDFQDNLSDDNKKLREQNNRFVSLNEALYEQNTRMRQQNKALKGQLEEYKQYCLFLANYNKDLKNQLLSFINKPSHKIQMPEEIQHIDQLKSQLNNLKISNGIKQLHLQSLSKNLYSQEERFDRKQSLASKLSCKSFIQERKTKRNYESQRKRRENMTKKGKKTQKIKVKKMFCPCHQNYIETGQFLH